MGEEPSQRAENTEPRILRFCVPMGSSGLGRPGGVQMTEARGKQQHQSRAQGPRHQVGTGTRMAAQVTLSSEVLPATWQHLILVTHPSCLPTLPPYWENGPPIFSLPGDHPRRVRFLTLWPLDVGEPWGSHPQPASPCPSNTGFFCA